MAMQILADSAGFGSEIEVFRPFEALPVSFHTERDNCSYYALCGDNQHTSFCRGYMEYRLSNGLIELAHFRAVYAQIG